MDGEEVCMPRSSRDEEFSAFVQTRRSGLVRSACLLTAGDTHLAEDLVQTTLARLYVAWPKVRRAGTESAYVWRIIVNAHIDDVRRPSRRRERHVPELPELPAPPEVYPDGPRRKRSPRRAGRLAARDARGRGAAALARPQRGGDGRTDELLRGHGQEPDREGGLAAARPAQPGRHGKDPPVNDLKDLLELALSDVPGRDARVDPAADLARGRRLLRRRRQRLAGLVGVTAAVLCGVLVPLALQGSAPSHHPAPAAVASSRPQPIHSQPGQSAAPDKQSRQIRLVAWVGTQPPGYQVAWMPKGWVVQ